MSTLTLHPVRTTIDGMAGIGRTRLDLMGIRFDENDGGNTGADAADAAQATTDAAAAASATPGTPAAWDGKIESLDAGVQKIIGDLRKENGDRRVALTASETRTAAILAAAGIKTDETDPVKLLETRTAERDTLATSGAASARELAIYKAAGTLADPSKLLDSNAFLTSVAGIDPADGPAIIAAITAAVTANPNLKAARAAGASGIDLSGGTGEQGQITDAQLAQMTPEQIADAYTKGLLKTLL
jgi:hypothetical protein